MGGMSRNINESSEGRPDKDVYYLKIAEAVGARSPCLRRKFGAIIVVNDAIVSTGYNGPARGSVNCRETGCLKDMANAPMYSSYDLCPAVHAEENTVINAARNGVSVYGGVLYIVGKYPDGRLAPSHPCDRCKRVLINAGVKKVITIDEEGNIVEFNVSDWVDYDRAKYLEKIKRFKDGEL